MNLYVTIARDINRHKTARAIYIAKCKKCDLSATGVALSQQESLLTREVGYSQFPRSPSVTLVSPLLCLLADNSESIVASN